MEYTFVTTKGELKDFYSPLFSFILSEYNIGKQIRIGIIAYFTI